MDKDERYVISILSILKSNCIYVPISKIYPNERVASILKSSKAKAMIVDRESSWMNQHGIFILNYDDLLANEKEKFIYNDMKCELEAYILFTSGSTGMPKGILVRQHSVVNLINSMAKELIEDNHKVKIIGILSQFVFDVSVAQMYLELLTGNTLGIICDDIRFEPEKLMQFFKDVHMDICEFTPMYLDMLVKYCEINKINLFLPKYVLNIGEALPYGLAKRVLELKDIEIFNYYGPTEVTVYATYFRINRNNIDKLYDILIGRPINNVQIYIFDNKMNLCDIGEEGELYIAGDGVTNGYVSNEEITKKSFIKNIYDEKMMMYKTGDIAKLTKSGDIQYIGRMDDQIKVRGFRIELKEMEIT